MTESPEVLRALARLPRTSLPDPEAAWQRIRAGLDVPRRRPLRGWLVAVVAAAAVVIGGSAGVWWRYRAPTSWTVVRLAGTPVVDGIPIRDAGALDVGDWLETDAVSRVHLSVGRIGSADVGPASRVRLERDGSTAHRLTLERGSIQAVISAPPRLFFVRTPSVLATDLGCAYTLEVDSAGTSRLHVTAGWVELREGDGVSLVPAGLVAVVETGRRPGTPYPEDFPEPARAALARLDGGRATEGDLDLVLTSVAAATDYVTYRQRGGITLWHLLQRVTGDERIRVVDRLSALSAPPDDVTREGIHALDRPMLERWRRDLNPMWSEEAQPWYTRVTRGLWMWAMR